MQVRSAAAHLCDCARRCALTLQRCQALLVRVCRSSRLCLRLQVTCGKNCQSGHGARDICPANGAVPQASDVTLSLSVRHRVRLPCADAGGRASIRFAAVFHSAQHCKHVSVLSHLATTQHLCCSLDDFILNLILLFTCRLDLRRRHRHDHVLLHRGHVPRQEPVVRGRRRPHRHLRVRIFPRACVVVAVPMSCWLPACAIDRVPVTALHWFGQSAAFFLELIFVWSIFLEILCICSVLCNVCAGRT